MLPTNPNDSFPAMPRPVSRRPLILSLIPLAILLAWGCDDPFAAFLLDVPEVPSEATLFDFIDGRLQDPPAFDIVRERPARVDQTRDWDFLFRVVGGGAELVPFTAVTDSVTDSGLRVAETSFEGVLEAPETGYILTEPIPVAIGDVLIARSRRDARQVLACSQFAKLEILDLDIAAGQITFRYLVNPNCGDTVLEPGEHGEL